MFAKLFKKHIIRVSGESAVYTPVIRINQPQRPVNFIARSEPVFSYQRFSSES